MSRCTALVMSLVLATGCTVLASANRGHSGATTCMSSPVPSGVDLVIGIAGIAGMAAAFDEDDSRYWYLLPATFLTSGVLGTFSAWSCRSGGDQGFIAQKGTPEQYNAPAEGSPAPTGDNPAPDTRDATPAETGITTTGPKADLRLDPSYRPKDAPPPVEDTRVQCHINPLTPCPENESCVLVDKDHGYCVPDR